MACEDFRRVLMELRQEIFDEYHISNLHCPSFSPTEDQKVPNNAHCCDAPGKSRFSRQDVLKEIETVVLNILKSLEKENIPCLEHYNLDKWDNIRYTENHGLSVISGPKMTQVSFGTSKSITKFSLILKVLAVIYKLVQTNSYRTKRDIYYEDVKAYGKQSTLDAIVVNISYLLKIPRWDLHILATSKGCVSGDLQFNDSDGNFYQCRNIKSGVLLPAHILGITNIHTRAAFILVVEKDATFQHLLNYGFCEEFHPCILITGKGFPDVNTRLFLRKLWDELHIPIFGLMDADAYGIEIMFVYKFGSKSSSLENDSLAVPALRWLGIFPSEIKRLHIPKEMQLPVTKADINKAKELIKRPYIKRQKNLLHEIEIFLEQQLKTEIQSLNGFSNVFLTRVYIPQKIKSKDVIMAGTNIEVLAILRHCFKLDLKAAEVPCRIWKMEGNKTISNCTAQIKCLKLLMDTHLGKSPSDKIWSMFAESI